LWSKREQLAEIETFRTYLFRAARITALITCGGRSLERRWQEEQGVIDEPPNSFSADDERSQQEVAQAVRRRSIGCHRVAGRSSC
jgi:DNA-directed RNA polymerase specialized sigma24 family protein